jgi:glutamate synthase (NADPH/NADH) small chain
MDYLPQSNKVNLGDKVENQIHAKDKHVIILGGGDTGADCLGTAQRQGAKSIRQFELLPRPPEGRTADMPWPYWPMIYRTSSAHEESNAIAGGEIRDFAINTKKFSGENGVVKKLHGIRLEWEMQGSRPMKMKEIPGSDFELDCDLCFLALGFVSPEQDGPIGQLGLKVDHRGNVVVNDDYETSVPGVFAAGDMRRGQSLVVWAISEGRSAAHGVDQFLMGRSDLPKLKLF